LYQRILKDHIKLLKKLNKKRQKSLTVKKVKSKENYQEDNN